VCRENNELLSANSGGAASSADVIVIEPTGKAWQETFPRKASVVNAPASILAATGQPKCFSVAAGSGYSQIMDTEIHEIPIQPLSEMVSGKARSALIWAAEAHSGQVRKQVKNSLEPENSVPYIIHLVTVMNILTKSGASRNLICAGCLHDIVEDCDVTLDQIEQEFGERVARYVRAVTKTKDLQALPMEEKADAVLEMCLSAGVNGCALKSADLLANMSDLVWDAESGGKDTFSDLFGPAWEGKVCHYIRLAGLLSTEIELNYPALAISLRVRARELAALADCG